MRRVVFTVLFCNLVAYLIFLNPSNNLSAETEAEMHYRMGGEYTMKGEFEFSEEEFKASIQSDPNFALAYYGLGVLYFGKVNRPQEAVKIFKEGLRKVPTEKRLHFGLATAYLKLGDLDNSEMELNEALSIDSNYSDARQSLEIVRKLKEKNISKEAIVRAYNKSPLTAVIIGGVILIGIFYLVLK